RPGCGGRLRPACVRRRRARLLRRLHRGEHLDPRAEVSGERGGRDSVDAARGPAAPIAEQLVPAAPSRIRRQQNSKSTIRKPTLLDVCAFTLSNLLFRLRPIVSRQAGSLFGCIAASCFGGLVPMSVSMSPRLLCVLVLVASSGWLASA